MQANFYLRLNHCYLTTVNHRHAKNTARDVSFDGDSRRLGRYFRGKDAIFAAFHSIIGIVSRETWGVKNLTPEASLRRILGALRL
jgi:hypothetical protein